MRNKKNTTLAIRNLILKKRSEGQLIEEIAREIRVPKSTVGDIIKRNNRGYSICDNLVQDDQRLQLKEKIKLSKEHQLLILVRMLFN